MTIESAILKNIEKLPESVKQAVFLYTEFLANQYAKEKPDEEETKPKKRRLAGSMKGTFVLPLPDYFDAPLELVDSASKTAKEQKYGYGSLAGQIIISDDFDEPLEEFKQYM